MRIALLFSVLSLQAAAINENRPIRIPLPDNLVTQQDGNSGTNPPLQVFRINEAPAMNPPLQVVRINGPIVFDGVPDEAVWQQAPALQMVMHMPVPGNEPTEVSVIRLAYDDQYFYVSGFFEYKDIRHLRALGKKRDYNSRSSSFFGFILDTFNDRENALLFMTNPHGLRLDGTIKNNCEVEDEDTNTSWNTFWDVEAVITEKGWSAEIRIPFSSLRFQDTDGKTLMGITLMRWSPAKPEMSTFPEVTPKLTNAYWRPSLSVPIEFVGLRSQKPLYITPYVISGAGQLNELNPAGTAYKMNTTPKLDAGGDLKYSLTNNLTMDLTVNTDFAQVEADDQKINLTRYSLYFPEKRVFFQEKSDVFDFSFLEGNNLFYSRRIGLHQGNAVRIYGGGRITGRINKWDVGFLDMQTESFMDNPSENFGVLRLKRNVFNPNSYAGAMVTSRLGMDGTYNVAYGLDGQFRVTGDEYLTIRMAQSIEDEAVTSPGNSSGNTSGSSPLDMSPTRLLLQWQRRNNIGLSYDLVYSWAGENYNPGMGFERKRSFRGPSAIVRYGWWPGAASFLRYHRISLIGHSYMNAATGDHETTNAAVMWYFQSKKLYGGSIRAGWYVEDLPYNLVLGNNQAVVPPGRYTFANVTALFATSTSRNLSAQFQTVAGNFYNGRRLSFFAGPQLKIGSDFDVGLTYYFDYVSFPERGMSFTNHIVGVKGLMTLTTSTSLAAFVQYNTAINRVIANVRFRLNPREGNDFYLVYDEGLNTGIHRVTPALPFSTGRTILLKYTYTFIF